jgi:hypothetical protein
VDPTDTELLEGMGNCFAACHADFAETIRMVSRSRGRAAEEVIAALRRMRRDAGRDPDYVRLRARFPAEFPV